MNNTELRLTQLERMEVTNEKQREFIGWRLIVVQREIARLRAFANIKPWSGPAAACYSLANGYQERVNNLLAR